MEQPTVASAAGIRTDPGRDEGMDVLFDGNRVWSFKASRDGAADPDGWLVRWPNVLRPHLHGRTRVTIQPVGPGRPLYDAEVAFGTSEKRINVVDRQGNRLAVDKGGRLQRGFGDTDPETRGLIVETVQRVLRDLHEQAGLDAFLSFGCLLGAVREGKMIGHDADADVSFLSRHTHPFDIAREVSATVRIMRALGYTIAQMSAADFKIWARLPDGRRCGIDVFCAYYFNGLFHMLPNVRGDLPRAALLPTSTVTLEGREVVAPAEPEQLLAIIYGDTWQVPDPSFKFRHPRAVSRHMGGYWHGTRKGLRHWNEFYRRSESKRVPTGPSPFARWVVEHLEPGADILEVAHGNGRDAVWLAGQGHAVTALEFSRAAQETAKALHHRVTGHDDPVQLRFARLNFNNLDSVLIAGASYAFEAKTRHIQARFLLDALGPQARGDFWRFASMVQRKGGRTFVEFRTYRSRREATAFGPHRRFYLRPDRVVAEIEKRGGTVVERIVGRGLAPFENEDPEVCRLIVGWDR